MLAMLVLAALPAVWYIWREFLGAMPADWLWDLAPATFTWQTAASRTPALIPTPAWPPAVWLAAAAAVWTLAALGRGKKQPAVREPDAGAARRSLGEGG
jgi:hypothetical protein